MRKRGCCFTGHRKIPRQMEEKLKFGLRMVIEQLIAEGIHEFRTGGALGFDTLAAEAVLELRENFPEICLVMVLPCRDQAKYWTREEVSRYRNTLVRADEVICLAERYTPGCMQRRNQYLVAHSEVCVAYCVRRKSGTGYTVACAERQGLRVIRLDELYGDRRA